jgi:hypothetical protein
VALQKERVSQQVIAILCAPEARTRGGLWPQAVHAGLGEAWHVEAGRAVKEILRESTRPRPNHEERRHYQEEHAGRVRSRRVNKDTKSKRVSGTAPHGPARDGVTDEFPIRSRGYRSVTRYVL